MADFVSNLLLRSAVAQPAAAILKPRVLSLFEPLRGPGEIPMLSPDTAAQEISAPSSRPSMTESLQKELPAGYATIASELRPWQATDPSLGPRQMPPSAPEEIGKSSSQRIRAGRPIPFPEDPQDTIFPRDGHEVWSKSNGLSRENRPLNSDQSASPINADSLPLLGQKADEKNLPIEVTSSPLQTRIGLTKEASLEETARHAHIAPTLKGELKSVMMQPSILTPSRLSAAERFEQSQEHQQVIEVHIGRIEVRAVLPVTKTRERSQLPALMSLEDYLRSRSGEKR